MATNSSAGAMIVKEFLNKGNYPEWSVCMKNYLLAQDLWDVVEQHCTEPKKNAAAFHAILISCTTEAADLILDCSSAEDSARDAWDTLASAYNAGDENVVELLNNKNYKKWRVCMKSRLFAQDLWDVVKQSQSEIDDWEKRDAAAFREIKALCEKEAVDLILDCCSTEDSARDAWNTLACAYNSGDAVDKVFLNKRNYKKWRVFMKSSLLAKDLWDVVKPSQSEGDTRPHSEINVWKQKSVKAFGAILTSCGREAKNLIWDCGASAEDLARESWNTLASAYNSGAVIVKEFLNKENYGEWSECMKKYLKGKDLWGVVAAVAAGSDVYWKWKNKLAFHAIWISCGDEAAHLISDLTSAKAAWDKLADGYGSVAAIHRELRKRKKYKEWRDYMKKYLEDKDLWDVVESGNTRRGAAAAAESDVDWKRKNDLAFGTICMSCDQEAADLISKLSSAKAAWDKLADVYESESECESAPLVGDWETDGYDPQYNQLYKHIRAGDWDKTLEFVNAHPEALTAKISSDGHTPLHAAAAFDQLHIVEGLVELMSEEDLELKNTVGWTPLVCACAVGSTKVAECMVNKNMNLPTIPFLNDTRLPVTEAAIGSNKEMAGYLYSVTPLEVLLPENGHHGASLLIVCLLLKSLDMALDLLRRCPRLALTPSRWGNNFVSVLATMPSLFPSGCQIGFFQKWIYNRINIEPTVLGRDIRVYIHNSITRESENNISLIGGLVDRMVLTFHDLFGIKQMYETKFVHRQAQQFLDIICDQISTMNSKELESCKLFVSIIEAAKNGILEFIMELTKAQPRLVWSNDDNYENFFYSAIQYRQAKVFSLIYGYIWKDQATNTCNKNGFTMLHMAGKLPSEGQLNYISGAALQMQRELQWFKEVDGIVPPIWKSFKNEDGVRAKDLFTKQHKDLVKNGEKWMKNTATSCTVVGALIVTIMFAAAFTIPGGNNQTTGYPIFKNKVPFMIFIISDAVSLFSSSTSVLMFLGILTSRYDEGDFLKSLPIKLIIGLSLLFISIATMMVAFSSALFIMLEGKIWIITPVFLLASVPIGLFAKLQFPILVEIFNSTFRLDIFDSNVKRWP